MAKKTSLSVKIIISSNFLFPRSDLVDIVHTRNGTLASIHVFEYSTAIGTRLSHNTARRIMYLT